MTIAKVIVRGKKTDKWYITFTDHNRLRRRLVAFEDKAISQKFADKLDDVLGYRRLKMPLPAELNQWINTLPDDLLDKLSDWDIISTMQASQTQSIKTYVDEFILSLSNKGLNPAYIRNTKHYLDEILRLGRFAAFRDINKTDVEKLIVKLKKDFKPTTVGHYIGGLQSFMNWAAEAGKISSNPISGISKPQRNSEQKGILTQEQFLHLIRYTFDKNIIIGGISGQERAVLYAVAGLTGIRKNELIQLVWRDINLAEGFVMVRAAIAKNKRQALQPLPELGVRMLSAWMEYLKADISDRVFSFNVRTNTADLIRADLQTADIPLIDKDGNEICFHSLRNSFITYLANSNTPAKVVQELARHSDPKLTFNTYARVLEESKQTAISFLPDFNLDYAVQKEDPKSLLRICCAQKAENSGNRMETVGNETAFLGEKTGFCENRVHKKTPRVGFEPTT